MKLPVHSWNQVSVNPCGWHTCTSQWLWLVSGSIALNCSMQSKLPPFNHLPDHSQASLVTMMVVQEGRIWYSPYSHTNCHLLNLCGTFWSAWQASNDWVPEHSSPKVLTYTVDICQNKLNQSFCGSTVHRWPETLTTGLTLLCLLRHSQSPWLGAWSLWQLGHPGLFRPCPASGRARMSGISKSIRCAS